MQNADEIWKKYKKTKDDKAREEIIKHYLPLVKYHTDRIVSGLPAEVRHNDREDLYIEGVIGLMEAVERFEPERNLKFETFATKRVRGAIIDALRKEDLLPKHVRAAAKLIENAYSKLDAELGRSATDEEIIKELKMTKNVFYDMLNSVKPISLVSLDSEIFNKDGDKYYFEDIIGQEPVVLFEFEKNELKGMLIKFIDEKDKEERNVIELYYWDELTLKEIGLATGLSESRVCQIHTKIILKLRGSFRKTENER